MQLQNWHKIETTSPCWAILKNNPRLARIHGFYSMMLATYWVSFKKKLDTATLVAKCGSGGLHGVAGLWGAADITIILFLL
jgi:hypothetical protein